MAIYVLTSKGKKAHIITDNAKKTLCGIKAEGVFKCTAEDRDILDCKVCNKIIRSILLS
jgi:hypothetical protein